MRPIGPEEPIDPQAADLMVQHAGTEHEAVNHAALDRPSDVEDPVDLLDASLLTDGCRPVEVITRLLDHAGRPVYTADGGGPTMLAAAAYQVRSVVGSNAFVAGTGLRGPCPPRTPEPYARYDHGWRR